MMVGTFLFLGGVLLGISLGLFAASRTVIGLELEVQRLLTNDSHE